MPKHVTSLVLSSTPSVIINDNSRRTATITLVKLSKDGVSKKKKKAGEMEFYSFINVPRHDDGSRTSFNPSFSSLAEREEEKDTMAHWWKQRDLFAFARFGTRNMCNSLGLSLSHLREKAAESRIGLCFLPIQTPLDSGCDDFHAIQSSFIYHQFSSLSDRGTRLVNQWQRKHLLGMSEIPEKV